MNRVLVASGVAVVNGHSYQGHRWQSGVKSIHPGIKRLFSGSGANESLDICPIAGVASRYDLVDNIVGTGDDRRRRQVATDEFVRQAMFMNCWGTS